MGAEVSVTYPVAHGLAEPQIMTVRLTDAITSLADTPTKRPRWGIRSPSGTVLLTRARAMWLTAQLMFMAVEARLSEYAMRTVAMQRATDNAEELVRRYAARYFRARKSELTAEQLENFVSHEIA